MAASDAVDHKGCSVEMVEIEVLQPGMFYE
ncbi:hypothetical protein HDE71_000746 [Janthinobacterium sp. S3M3]|nr:hypothetical protein [Janthinobacterium sp. S3T4]MBB5611749.1 hypothetical protein [Janthinobacterium sp. S3M3]